MTFYGGISAEELKQLIARIERLEEEKANISIDIKGVYAESKLKGFDPKIIRKIISMRKLDTNELQEQEHLIDTYMRAIGMIKTEE